MAAEAAERELKALTGALSSAKPARLSPVELAEEALRAAESEPLKAVELALEAVRLLNPSTFELESLERALKAHKARIRLESGAGLEQAVKELKRDLGEVLARARQLEEARKVSRAQL